MVFSLFSIIFKEIFIIAKHNKCRQHIFYNKNILLLSYLGIKNIFIERFVFSALFDLEQSCHLRFSIILKKLLLHPLIFLHLRIPI
jgi:hypothetical protein